jgi:hypothetical protein
MSEVGTAPLNPYAPIVVTELGIVRDVIGCPWNAYPGIVTSPVGIVIEPVIPFPTKAAVPIVLKLEFSVSDVIVLK